MSRTSIFEVAKETSSSEPSDFLEDRRLTSVTVPKTKAWTPRD